MSLFFIVDFDMAHSPQAAPARIPGRG
jgi:hypothetical protein